jgi:hypothetical protein
MALTGYARTFTLADRSAMAAIILPMGRLSGEVTAAGKTFNESTNGFGDPMLEFTVNLLGPKAQKALPDVLRYEPGFSVDFLADLALPIGNYNSSQPLNLGQNRWYGRLGAPIVWQLGPWVPGRRTTLEFLPAVWLFGDNNNYVGQTLKTDPLFQLDAHLTRDFTESFWGSLDAVLVQRRQGQHQRSRRDESQQRRRGTHAGLSGQRQHRTHLRLQVNLEQTAATRRPAHGQLHVHAGVRVEPDARGGTTAEEREVVVWRSARPRCFTQVTGGIRMAKTDKHNKTQGAPQTDTPYLSADERAASGKALRDAAPRTSHAGWQPFEGRRDPVELLSASNQGRVPELIPIRFGRMSASPFAFYRGSAALMAADLAHTATSGIRVQACGDAHLMNFGGFATPERNVIFDINDLDETLPPHSSGTSSAWRPAW